MFNERTLDELFAVVERVTSEGDRSGSGGGTVLPDYIQALEDELNNSLCECGATLGDHSHDERQCPNPADVGPLYLDRYFVHVDYVADTMKKVDSWMISRGQA